MTFGINSAIINTINVVVIVWINTNRISELIYCKMTGSNNTDMDILKITNAILFPTSIVAIKFDWFSEKREIILEKNEVEFLSISSFSLFEEIKAISLPEKNADNNNVIIIKLINIGSIY